MLFSTGRAFPTGRLHRFPMALASSSSASSAATQGTWVQKNPVKTVLVPIGTGSEEIETCCIADTLVRAGASVTIASVDHLTSDTNLVVTMSRGVKLVADCSIEDCVDQNWDLVACPGGVPGSERLRDSAALETILRKQASPAAAAEGKWFGAMCAAPALVLAPHGLLENRAKATCFPAERFTSTLGDKYVGSQAVVVDGNCVTSKGPGTSLLFAIRLVEALFGEEKADEIASQMLVEW